MHLQSRILVTDGSGFLGSHLCGKLLAYGAPRESQWGLFCQAGTTGTRPRWRSCCQEAMLQRLMGVRTGE